jgi:Na+/melibiose symporter-like transporter
MCIFPIIGVRRGLGHPFLARFFLFCFLICRCMIPHIVGFRRELQAKFFARVFLFIIRVELCKMPRIAVGAISPLAYVAEVVTRVTPVAERPMASRAENKLCHRLTAITTAEEWLFLLIIWMASFTMLQTAAGAKFVVAYFAGVAAKKAAERPKACGASQPRVGIPNAHTTPL